MKKNPRRAKTSPKVSVNNRLRIATSGLFALLLVFGVAPILGDGIQASLLTRGAAIEQEPGSQKEAVLAIGDFVERCERLGQEECAVAGREILQNIGAASFEDLLNDLDELRAAYADGLAHAACRFDLRAYMLRAANLQKDLDEYSHAYGIPFSALPVDELAAELEKCS
ncbi:hypothetical protein COV82_03675 [Candidatus Peregrinibacteria bacterium CG11_big_fil_rev_8_21_14_0_20_46_8]|nr:MAG: hypothetical protein COV82_03675 [Candidatus Peregrinibacteria bacterium CG11_big_fil_rev_8_21_14_0_20_46_8]